MCYEYENLEWLRRAEQARRDAEQADKRRKDERAGTPAKPAESETGRQPKPVPA